MAWFHSILCLSNIPLYMCTHFLYPFLCWWTFRLLPFLGYCKQHCNEYWRACILSDHVFLQAYAQQWDCRVIVVVQSPSHVQLFATPWTAAFEASLSITVSQSLPKFMFIASVMLSGHLILWCPLLLLPSVFPSIRKLFLWVICLYQITKILEFQLQHQSFQWIFRVDLP